ncbi:MAG TPA: uroporphyrinogen-III synthase [Saprospiraceae bacterium]|nr:uroporphyrinogen-III synthase [Saprospiraceae bacterium]
MDKTLFISRSLASDSPVRAFAQKHQLELRAESLIEFTPVQFGTPPPADWLFFYSKKGVQYFMRTLRDRGQKLNTPVAVLGLGTLNALKEFGKSADFAGNGRPEEVAAAFKKIAAGQRVLFVRAQQSRRSIQKLLEGEVIVEDLIAYANEIRLPQRDVRGDYLLLTSPMNAEAYAQKCELNAAEIIVAIGQTTAAKLKVLGADQVEVAARPDEAAMLERLTEKLAALQ